ncbi:uncharacterized protein LOC125356803 [Perognathus longimembris pacificus]|uniref:uncharacterized protein LOC125356803 n=1 Tax=Perognathus longimembris pacificus TaxID=214514 RepID=UPI0020190FF1|nr:uncharacterized protein LOC125356803 [Perognathus longimembris pacificus]
MSPVMETKARNVGDHSIPNTRLRPGSAGAQGRGIALNQEAMSLFTCMAMGDSGPQNPFVSKDASSRENDPWKETPEGSLCLAKKAAVPEQSAQRKRAPKTRRQRNLGAQATGGCPAEQAVALSSWAWALARESPELGRIPRSQVLPLFFFPTAPQESRLVAPKAAFPDAAISELQFWRRRGQKKIWTVDHMEGIKLRINKKRRPSYRPEDQEAFYRLLEDPVIQSFLEADIFLKVSDKYLLSMVVEYFGRVGLPGHLYNRIHFFLALYIASDMEEDNPTSKRSIFQFLLGKEHWPDLYKEFLKLKVEFFHAMDHRAWVNAELCEEIQAQNPNHWVWSRVRQGAP